MRISDWSSDVCSSDLITGEWTAEVIEAGKRDLTLTPRERLRPREPVPDFWLCPALLKKDRFDLVLEDRQSVVSGKSAYVRVDLGGRRHIKKKKKLRNESTTTQQTIKKSTNKHT